MKLFFSLLLLLGCAFAQPQRVQTQPDVYVTDDLNSYGFFTPKKMYHGQIRYHGDVKKAVFPDLSMYQDTSYETEYFIGYPGAISREICVLICNYRDAAPVFFMDRNNNLDFTDDGAPIRGSQLDSSTVLTFVAEKNPAAKFPVRMIPLTDDTATLHEDMIFFDYYNKKDRFREPQYWWGTQRMNTRIADVLLGKDSARIALHDYNCNGFYNDADDRLIVAKSRSTDLRYNALCGHGIYGKDACISYKGVSYKISDIDPLGNSFSIAPAPKPVTRPVLGGKMPDFSFEGFDGKKHKLNNYVGNKQYTLINIWDIGCHGCILEIPQLVEMTTKYGDKFQVLSLAYDNAPTRKVLEKYNAEFIKGKLSIKISRFLFNEMFPPGVPFNILLDEHGTIVSVDIWGKTVEPYLR